MKRYYSRGVSYRNLSTFFILGMFVGAGLIGLLMHSPNSAAQDEIDFIIIRDAPGGSGNPVEERTYTIGDTDVFYAAGYNYSTGYVEEVEVHWSSYYPWVGEIDPDNRTSTWATFRAVGGGTTYVYASCDDPGGSSCYDDTGELTVISPVDEIIIRTEPGDGGEWVGDRTYHVGDTDTFYAAGYNDTTGYIGDVYVYWSSSNPEVGSVSGNDSVRDHTIFTALSAGSVVVTAFTYTGMQPKIENKTGTLTVIYYPIDYVVVRDADRGGGDWVGDRTYYVGDDDIFYAAGYNNTHGYQGDFAANWTSDNASACTVSAFGVSTEFNAIAEGSCSVTGEYAGKTNTTGTLTILPVITVDDSGGADYLTIQEAIDAADPGGRIFVYEGTYYENIIVNKTVRIKGQDLENTIIDGSGSGIVVLITADEVEIERFTIQNGEYGIFLDKSSGSKIIGNLIQNYDYGIYNNHTVDCYIAYNEVTNGKYGIVTYHANNDAVRYNTFSYNTVYGAKDFNSQLRNCFNWNKFYHNKIGYWYDPTIQLSVLEFDGNLLEYNEIGVKVSDASTVRITNNTIRHGEYGIYIENASPWIYRNDIENNKYGIYAKISSSRIEKNSITGSEYGIYIEDCSDLELSKNYVDDITLQDSTAIIRDSTVPELSLINSEATLFGSTVDDHNVDKDSSFKALWHLKIRVEDDNGDKISDATVRILDYHGDEVMNLITGSDGRTEQIALTEYVVDFQGQAYHTPHTVIAEKEDAKSEEVVLMSENKYIELTIKMPVSGSGGVPWLFLMVIGSVAALSVAGLLATEVGKYALIALFVPLYMKLKKESVLDHYDRGRVYQYIALNPGDHFNLIKKNLGLKNGSLTYHLQVLEKANKVKSRQDGIYKRFYPFDSVIPQSNGGLTEVQKRIVGSIRDLPGVSQKELAAVLGLHQSTLSYQLTKLESTGAIRSVRSKKNVLYYINS